MSTPSVTILKNLVLNWESNQMEEDDVSSFTLNPSWLSCEDETQRCIMVEIYLEP